MWHCTDEMMHVTDYWESGCFGKELFSGFGTSGELVNEEDDGGESNGSGD